MCVVVLAAAMPSPGRLRVAVRAASARFQARTISPWSMPSSAGFSAHISTSGSSSASSE